MVEMFNCTFALFSNQFYPNKDDIFEECAFKNTSKDNADHFLSYISNSNGKGNRTKNIEFLTLLSAYYF